MDYGKPISRFEGLGGGDESIKSGLDSSLVPKL